MLNRKFSTYKFLFPHCNILSESVKFAKKIRTNHEGNSNR